MIISLRLLLAKSNFQNGPKCHLMDRLEESNSRRHLRPLLIPLHGVGYALPSMLCHAGFVNTARCSHEPRTERPEASGAGARGNAPHLLPPPCFNLPLLSERQEEPQGPARGLCPRDAAHGLLGKGPSARPCLWHCRGVTSLLRMQAKNHLNYTAETGTAGH